nr:hypothetical protein [Tanacetum cinerariifolium]
MCNDHNNGGAGDGYGSEDFVAGSGSSRKRKIGTYREAYSGNANIKNSVVPFTERKSRFLKVAHSTSTMADSDRWSLQEEILKPFATSLKLMQKGMHGVYQCENALWIWPQLRNSRSATHAIP